MRTIKTNLTGKSNAVLTDYDDCTVIAIISCGKSENITKKIQKAIDDFFDATDFEMEYGEVILDNENPVMIYSTHIESNLETCRDFKLQIIPTY